MLRKKHENEIWDNSIFISYSGHSLYYCIFWGFMMTSKQIFEPLKYAFT